MRQPVGGLDHYGTGASLGPGELDPVIRLHIANSLSGFLHEVRSTWTLLLAVLTPEECDVYRSRTTKHPGTPLGVRYSGLPRTQPVEVCAVQNQKCQLYNEYGTPKGVPNPKLSRTINIPLLWSEQPPTSLLGVYGFCARRSRK